MAFKALYIIFLCWLCTAASLDLAPASIETESSVSDKIISDVSDPQQVPSEDEGGYEDTNSYIREHEVIKTPKSEKNAAPRGRKIVAAIILLLVAAVAAYIYQLKYPFEMKKMPKVRKDIPELKARLEAPAEAPSKVWPHLIIDTRDALFEELLDWHKAFDLDTQTLSGIKSMVAKRYIEWEADHIDGIRSLINKTEYKPYLSEEEISFIVKERENILKEKIKPNLEAADPTLVTAAVQTLNMAINILEEDFNIEFTDLKNLLSQLNCKKQVVLGTTVYEAPVKGLKVYDSASDDRVKKFIFDCTPNLLRKIVLLNNIAAPFTHYIEQWEAKITQPDEYVLTDHYSNLQELEKLDALRHKIYVSESDSE